jgi:hypothetical protein
MSNETDTPAMWLTEVKDEHGVVWLDKTGDILGLVNQALTAKYGNPDDIDWALANAEHWMRECEELERQLAEAQRDLLTREEGGEWVSRCDHEDALAEASKDTERLDWLTKGISEEWNPETREYFKHIPIPYIPCMIGERYRQAIDKAMKEGE